jgi:hypothetical protein
MLRINEIKKGNYFLAMNDGDVKLGIVTDVDRFNHQVCIDNSIQEFWYDLSKIKSLPLSEKALMQLKFSKQSNQDGTIKYSKGAFRVLIPKEGDFTKMEIWHRDEHRHIHNPIFVHELQNHFYSMTKVELNNVAY